MQTLANLITHISLNMPELSYVDEDYGQLEALQQPDTDTYPLTFPAVLINTEGVDWSSISDGAQTGVGTVRVRLLIDCYDDMHAGSNTTNKAADRQAVVHRLHTILEGHRPNEEGALTRTSSKNMVGFRGIKIYDQYYTYSAKEFTQSRIMTSIRKITLKTSRI